MGYVVIREQKDVYKFESNLQEVKYFLNLYEKSLIKKGNTNYRKLNILHSMLSGEAKEAISSCFVAIKLELLNQKLFQMHSLNVYAK